MRFHVIALPHTQHTAAFSDCAYTQKSRKFCRMMMSLGHEVFLYAPEFNDVPVTRHEVCITEADQNRLIGGTPSDLTRLAFDPAHPAWTHFNNLAAVSVNMNAVTGDFLCIIAGRAQESIVRANPLLSAVEYGVGYSGVLADTYRVFESYAWMHTVYGSMALDASTVDGRFYDAVIPNFFDPDDFPYSPDKGSYALFVGRCIPRKGLDVAIDATRAAGVELLVAGIGEHQPPAEHVTYLGRVDPIARGELMTGARCLIAPTTYIEPFGGVVVEAMMCGTPVITTDWGAFTETVLDGITGYRCHTLGEFVVGIQAADALYPEDICNYAIENYSLDRVRHQYQAYFEQLETLHDEGWYSMWTPSDSRYVR